MANDRRAASAKARKKDTGAQKARKEFCERMVKMIDNSDSSDIVIRCRDEQSILASRLQLMSGSEKLKKMVASPRYGARAVPGPSSLASRGEIPLVSTSSTTLFFILEYLYTGEMFNHRPWKTVEQVVDIVKVSGELGVTPCKLIVIEDLNEMISRFNANDDSEKISKAALELSHSVGFAEPGSAPPPDPGGVLEKILEKSDLTPNHLRLLSLKAFTQYLQSTRSSRQLKNYTRFRQIVLWCITQAKPNSEDKEIAELLPNLPNDLLQNSSGARADFDRFIGFLGSERAKFDGLMKELRPQLEFWSMNPELFRRFVEPLKVLLQIDTDKILDENWEHERVRRIEGNDVDTSNPNPIANPNPVSNYEQRSDSPDCSCCYNCFSFSSGE